MANVTREPKQRVPFVNLHISIPPDLHRRVSLFAETNDMKNVTAFRWLVERALEEMEKQA
jgi:hypothetical protein